MADRLPVSYRSGPHCLDNDRAKLRESSAGLVGTITGDVVSRFDGNANPQTIAPAIITSAISSSFMPRRSFRTYSLCWPKRGAGNRGPLS